VTRRGGMTMLVGGDAALKREKITSVELTQILLGQKNLKKIHVVDSVATIEWSHDGTF
jgi:hypothetical protein